MNRTIIFIAITIAASTLLPACISHTHTQPRDDDPGTVAEASGYAHTASSQDVRDFLNALEARSPLIHLSSIGTTNEGRPIPLAVIADPPVNSPNLDPNDKRLTVLLIGNIHAGEVCGKEALLSIARQLTTTPNHPLLKDLIICLIPNYNPDGNNRFAPDNRPGQIGPDEMGQRHNAQDLDLNRDYVKAEAPETRALIGFLAQWDPAVTVDTHTTNGSLHRYTLTYQGPKHPATDPELLAYVRDTMLPGIDRTFEHTTNYKTFFYGNFWEDHTLWVTYPAEPRYGVVYRGLRNRISILSEAYAYATFKDRVLATRAFCNAILRYSAHNKAEIQSLIHNADQHTIQAGRNRAPIALRNQSRPFPKPVTVLGYAHDPETEGYTNTPRDYQVQFVNDFVPTLTVNRPAAYAIPPSLTSVIQLLDTHAIQYHVTDAPFTTQTLTYTINSFDRADRAFQGHRNIANVKATPHLDTQTIPTGTIIVPTTQPLATLAALILESQSSDGATAWNLLDQHIDPGSTYPIISLLDPPPTP